MGEKDSKIFNVKASTTIGGVSAIRDESKHSEYSYKVYVKEGVSREVVLSISEKVEIVSIENPNIPVDAARQSLTTVLGENSPLCSSAAFRLNKLISSVVRGTNNFAIIRLADLYKLGYIENSLIR